MKINDFQIMKLFVLYFNHAPKIYDNIDYYKEEGTNALGDFYFGCVPKSFTFDWFILNMKSGEAIIMHKGSFVLSNINSIKDLIRFIRIFRNYFIGSPHIKDYKNIDMIEDEEWDE
jgi:hypothetical protein